jgi:hypothetical protein
MKPVRRRILAASLALAVTPAGWARALAPGARAADNPYGPLRDPDRHGIRLPAGFAARMVARSGARVAGTSYRWHNAPHGGATFATASGG